ncbi:MAG: hypothetical protein HYR91_00480 [Flavobacteriia bacterium]|nr:hypothetical protein [Flavobacteriia bacterium]
MFSRIFFALIFVTSNLIAQVNDSTHIDSSKLHSPKKALIYSAILPTSGQFYNHLAMKKGDKGFNNIYWKAPLIYTSLAGTSFLLIQNQQKLHALKTEYENRIENPLNINEKWKLYDLVDLEILYKKTLTYRDLSILALGTVYFIQIIDANIEGHFVHFDISPDLTFQAYPKILPYNTIGIGINLNFY